ncbi:hypothetical protein NEOLEDRAFT_1131999 [Neolentinus lepideus HHB14362 ss-1]|uniref:Uncharacterized protein n=1 Tax=Neolentinus lepideus HHB14362 ss-1 TaxID=1314782 RepID=A0A165TDC8_9AGAM|nr:hypothetical protein NEOLEDRAFT_1131999 [Neolentinus lepideus HHB14362 ss-1]
MFMSDKAVTVVGIASLLLVSSPDAVTYAQTSDGVCSIDTWTGNSLGQSPCLVASYLQGVCDGGAYHVPALPAKYSYNGPTQASANDCLCNTVTYNLMSACSACQNGTVIAWSTWNTNCSTIYTDYPEYIPSGTRVPGWAYLNVTEDFWNGTAAEADVAAPESTNPIQKPTGSVVASASATLNASPLASMNSATSSTSSNKGAIVGGVVGAVLGAAVIVGLTWIVLHRRRTQETPACPMFEQQRTMDQGTTEYMSVPPFSPSTQKVYVSLSTS